MMSSSGGVWASMVRIEPHQTVEKKDMPAASPRKNVDVDEDQKARRPPDSHRYLTSQL